MSQIINLLMLQNSDFTASFQINDANSSPIDLSQLTIESQMKHEYTSNTSLDFTCNGFSNGYLILSLPASNTATVNAGSYVYDILVRDNSNNISRLIEGVITVTPGVTLFS